MPRYSPVGGQQSNHPYPNLQLRQPRCLRVQAGRRSPGSGSASSATAGGRTRPEFKAPRKSGPPSSAPLPSQTPNNPVQEPVELPSLGWMWQVGGGSSRGDAGGGSPASRPMPSAVSTVANLYEDRIKAKKSLGQNFLTDDSVLQDIVAAAAVGPHDLVLEVGPGTGNLTKHLLARGARVTAVEKDDTLYGRLQEEYREVAELTLVHGDAIKVGLEDIIRGMIQQERPDLDPVSEEDSAAAAAGPATAPDAPPPTAAAAGRGRPSGRRAAARKVKVVANLPYNITKDLLLLLLPLGDLISDLHIMIQHEAAVRLTERTPGGPEWRAANIRTLFYCTPRYRFRISRLKYDPVPGVDGALVTFSLLPPGSRPEVPSERGFHTLVSKAFSERRKKMRNSVQPLHTSDQVEAALAACGLNVDARAQDLTLEQFVSLSWQLHRQQVEAGLGLLRPQQPEDQPEGQPEAEQS
ncbi:hypothetical protein PLESTB_000082500 [Pleodorina starrii]|uniref:rRNA adenine N(6)-methyltransferase n=1 Tax=Pleodorina starrii TaxID=330485 RepID=A0A9W6EX42_9CHLO|nr:hypothetical protein PLESTM_000078900 [Pleodorina starrii]GLC48312.1 hypothetical protein PLESTB_000082500 [Pleodorina starrii]GLC66597.1 hypothetical protein PLESTF_000448300 [Pleodorina starrii]